jgi:hypothetical protein
LLPSDLLASRNPLLPDVYEGGGFDRVRLDHLPCGVEFGANLVVVRLLESSHRVGRSAEMRSGEPEFSRKSRQGVR